MPAPQTWGVTPEEVSALAPHITIKADEVEQLTTDPVFGATQPRAITLSQVDAFILDVAARVNVRIIRITNVTDVAARDVFIQAAHDLTLNGAASYLVAAAFPAKAGLNDQSSLSAEYWRRFTEGLDSLALAITEWLTPDNAPGGEEAVSGGKVVGIFPATSFLDPGVVTGYAVECPPGIRGYPWP